MEIEVSWANSSLRAIPYNIYLNSKYKCGTQYMNLEVIDHKNMNFSKIHSDMNFQKLKKNFIFKKFTKIIF